MDENLTRIGMPVKLYAFEDMDELQQTLVGETLKVSKIVDKDFIRVKFRGNDIKWPVAALECMEVLICQKK